MSHRPYPNVDRALHQLDRHDEESQPQSAEPERPLTTGAMFERLAASMHAVVPTAEEFVSAWSAALKPRPASSEEKSA